jgi:multidrug resistance efflux pump
MSQTTEPALSPFRPQAVAFHRRGGLRGDVLHITPGLLHAVQWFLIAVVVCACAFVCTAQVTDYASGPALVLLDNRRDVTATRAGVVDEIPARIGSRVRAGDVLLRLHAAAETTDLAATEQQLADQLVLLMRNPLDQGARAALPELRARRDVARTALERSLLRAPVDGVIADLRARIGQMVDVGAPLLALQAEPRGARITALLPGPERPRLQPGMPLRLHIDGFERTSLELVIERVDEQVLGPAEAVRAIGTELSGAFDVRGPIVLVHARLRDASFESRGVQYRLHHGMPARAEVAVQRKPLLYSWLPGLEGALDDVL